MSAPVLTTPGLRREPKQARSRARVDAAISALVDMIGHGNDRSITVADVAERIGVPVGSLYEYFEDVDSIADAAVARMLDRHDEVLRAVPVEGLSTPHDFVDVLFDAYLQLYFEQPAFVRLRYSTLWNERHARWMTERVEGFLGETAASFLGRAPGAGSPPAAARLGLIFSVSDAMLTRIYHEDTAGAGQLIDDAKATVKFMIDRVAAPPG